MKKYMSMEKICRVRDYAGKVLRTAVIGGSLAVGASGLEGCATGSGNDSYSSGSGSYKSESWAERQNRTKIAPVAELGKKWFRRRR